MIDPTRIIIDARFLQNSVFFSIAELKFVLQFPTLSDSAKCLWLFLAHSSAKDANLTCTLSYHEMAQGLNRSPESIRFCLSQLQQMGFLRVIQDCVRSEESFATEDIHVRKGYMLTLPNAGLLELKSAILAELPSRRLFSKEDSEKLLKHKPRIMINLMNHLKAV